MTLILSGTKRWGQRPGKSFRYDERALEELGNVVLNAEESFEDMLSMMPATCVVEVNSKKGKMGPVCIRLGVSVPSFRITPQTSERGKASIIDFTDQ